MMSREAYMLCPVCETPGERYLGPRVVSGLGVMRRHRCPSCRHIFISLQRVLVGRYAEIILDRIEPRVKDEDDSTAR